jgi:hypothetical protein
MFPKKSMQSECPQRIEESKSSEKKLLCLYTLSQKKVMALAKKKEDHHENSNSKPQQAPVQYINEKKHITEKYTVKINKEENKPILLKKQASTPSLKNESKHINILKETPKIKPDPNTKLPNNYITVTENKKPLSNNFIIENNSYPLHIIPKEPQIFKVKAIISNTDKIEVPKPKLQINSDAKPTHVIQEFCRRASCTPDPRTSTHIKDLGMELFTQNEIENVNSKSHAKFMSCRRQSMEPVKVKTENSFEMEWE